MAGALLLVGSIPLDTVEQVFRTIGEPLGRYLAYMPDGEVGDRRYRIDGIAYRVLNGHLEIETLRRPAPDENGVERWRPQGIHDQFWFRVKPGVGAVRFGDPGWRLGYTKDAVNSYFVFQQLKKEGVLPEALKFQISLPLTYSAVTLFFPEPEDHARIVPGFTAALRAEVAKMIELIPADDLAIKWALAVALAARPVGLGHSAECRGCRLGAPRRFPSSADTGFRGGRVFRTAARSPGGRREGIFG